MTKLYAHLLPNLEGASSPVRDEFTLANEAIALAEMRLDTLRRDMFRYRDAYQGMPGFARDQASFTTALDRVRTELKLLRQHKATLEKELGHL